MEKLLPSSHTLVQSLEKRGLSIHKPAEAFMTEADAAGMRKGLERSSAGYGLQKGDFPEMVAIRKDDDRLIDSICSFPGNLQAAANGDVEFIPLASFLDHRDIGFEGFRAKLPGKILQGFLI